MKLKRKGILIIAAVMLAVFICINGCNKKILYEEVKAEDVSKINITIVAYGNLYEDITDKNQIDKLMKYIHTLKVKPTNKEARNATPNVMLSITEKDGHNIGIDIFGDIAFIDPDEKYPGNYKIYGFNLQDFTGFCEKISLKDTRYNK